MIANPWQLRADVTTLDIAAQTWADMSAAMVAAADQLVATAQKAFTAGWDSMSAEGYEAHRKQVVGSLDSLALVAENISDTLFKVSGSLTAAQRRLDREWSFVAMIPHTVVGAEQMIVFSPDSDDQKHQVELAKGQATTIRLDLDHVLYGDADNLRKAKTEFDHASRQWAEVVARGPEALDVLGWRAAAENGGYSTTTVSGETQSGSVTAGSGTVGGVTAGSLSPISVSFTGASLGGAALAGASLFAAGRSARGRAVQTGTGTGAMGAAPMAGGAAAGRGGAMMGGRGGGRAGMRATGVLKAAPADPDSAEARQAREQKQKALAERKAAREARRAAREAREAEREQNSKKPTVNIVDDE